MVTGYKNTFFFFLRSGLIGPTDNTKPRSCSCYYKLRIGSVEKVVCKKAFCSILGIGKSRVERIIKLINNNVLSPIDKRGKHCKRENKKLEKTVFQIETHIESFPSRDSYYSRGKNDLVRYLSPDLNIKKMYELYMEKYESNTFNRINEGDTVILM